MWEKACPGKTITFKTRAPHTRGWLSQHSIPVLYFPTSMCSQSFLGLLAALQVVGLHPRGYKAYTCSALRSVKEPRVNNWDISRLVDESGAFVSEERSWSDTLWHVADMAGKTWRQSLLKIWYLLSKMGIDSESNLSPNVTVGRLKTEGRQTENHNHRNQVL